jgi:DNA primase
MGACCQSKLWGAREDIRVPLLCSADRLLLGRGTDMPGVDFRAVRDMIAMSEVLELIGYASYMIVDDVLRAPCPVHGSKSSKSRSFAVNLKRKVYHCFKCGAGGNHLDLFATCIKMRVYDAAIELCARLHRPVPWIRSRG